MSDELKLVAESRNEFGKGAARRIRRANKVPAVIYGHGGDPIHITLPGLLPTIIIMLILRMGSIFSVGYEKIMLMYNPATYETADVISTYVYRRAFESGDYSFSAAVGLFNSVINFTIIMLFNKFSKKISEVSLW